MIYQTLEIKHNKGLFCDYCLNILRIIISIYTYLLIDYIAFFLIIRFTFLFIVYFDINASNQWYS